MKIITFVFAMVLMIGFFVTAIRFISIITDIRDIFYMEFTQKYTLDKIDKFKERSENEIKTKKTKTRRIKKT